MTEVYGVRDTVRALREIEPALARAATTSIKTAAEPARAGVAAATPARPLSGMPAGRVSATTRYGGRKQGDTRPLVRVQLRGPRWAVIADMARRSAPGESMVANLNARYGPASRWVWPAVERHRGGVVRAVQTAVADVERTLNTALRRGR